MIRIYADFNSVDEQGRVVLNVNGSKEDLEKYQDLLASGLRVILYMTGEFEVDAILFFEKVWLGIPDWKTIQYYDASD